MSNIDTLTIEEAKLYQAFKKHREKFRVLLNGGVFEVEEGKTEINYHNNQIQSVFIHRMVYKHVRISPVDNSDLLTNN